MIVFIVANICVYNVVAIIYKNDTHFGQTLVP